MKKLIVTICLTFILAPSLGALAYVRESANYRLEADSLNAGGRDDSQSANYNLADTVGEIATGESASASFNIKAGYRQMDSVYISLSAPADIDLSPSLSGFSGGSATGDGTWNVKTDSPSGYSLSIKANTDPAMRSGSGNFADYTPAAAGTPDYDWGLAGANSEFGFSPYNSSSQADKFKNDGLTCNTGAIVTDGKCWYPLSTTDEAVAIKSSGTSIAGEDTKINFQAEIGGTQAAGSYTATVVATAASN